jgi:hypothetical protein
MITTDKLVGIWKDVFMTCFMVLFQYLPGDREEDHEKSQGRQ